MFIRAVSLIGMCQDIINEAVLGELDISMCQISPIVIKKWPIVKIDANGGRTRKADVQGVTAGVTHFSSVAAKSSGATGFAT